MTVSFYGSGSEATGSISRRMGITGEPLPPPANAKYETTGSCGYYSKEPNIDSLEKDVVSFRGHDNKKNSSSSVFGTLLTIGALAAVIVGGLGYAHKYGAVNKITNNTVKGWLKNSNKITEPCYKLCKGVKDFCITHYKDIVKYIKK